MRYLLTISYDGSKYMGYQKQKEEKTVQSELEQVLTKLNSENPVCVVAAGRTDRGVHALGQMAHVDLIKEWDEELLRHSMNRLLSNSIYVKKIKRVEDDFHARYHVVKKRYEYLINLGEYDPLKVDYMNQYNQSLDLSLMKEAANYLLGTHDFSSFVKKTDLKEDNVRTIYEINFKLDQDILSIEFCGTGFLRYMIRNMVGTLMEVGKKKIPPTEVKRVLKAQDRVEAYQTAPACGLYLKEVFYQES